MARTIVTAQRAGPTRFELYAGKAYLGWVSRYHSPVGWRWHKQGNPRAHSLKYFPTAQSAAGAGFGDAAAAAILDTLPEVVAASCAAEAEGRGSGAASKKRETAHA